MQRSKCCQKCFVRIKLGARRQGQNTQIHNEWSDPDPSTVLNSDTQWYAHTLIQWTFIMKRGRGRTVLWTTAIVYTIRTCHPRFNFPNQLGNHPCAELLNFPCFLLTFYLQFIYYISFINFIISIWIKEQHISRYILLVLI